jgi:hypothetical protein
MRHVDGLSTQRFNRSHRRDGTLFRGRYKAILVDVEEYLNAVVRYIHLKPIEVGIVKSPEDYRWSSHRQYLKPKGAPKWLNTTEVLEQLGWAGDKCFTSLCCPGTRKGLKNSMSPGDKVPSWEEMSLSRRLEGKKQSRRGRW